MGIIIRTADTNFEDLAIGFIPPVTRGLAYWNYLGDNATKTKRNLATGLPVGLVGSPTYGVGYAALGETAYLQTAAMQTADITILAAFRNTVDANFVVVSNNGTTRAAPYTGHTYGTSLYGGINIVGDGKVTHSFNQNVFDGNSATLGQIATVAATTIVPINTFHFVSGKYDSSINVSSVNNITAGKTALTSAVAPNTIPDLGSFPIRIGHAYSTGLGTVAKDIAFCAIYNEALTDEEVSSIYETVQSYLATKAITI